MKRKWNLETLLFGALGFILLILFIVCYCKAQYGHKWYVMYSDSIIVVERCSICGQERCYNPY